MLMVSSCKRGYIIVRSGVQCARERQSRTIHISDVRETTPREAQRREKVPLTDPSDAPIGEHPVWSSRHPMAPSSSTFIQSMPYNNRIPLVEDCQHNPPPVSPNPFHCWDHAVHTTMPALFRTNRSFPNAIR